jgi:hypothetical protein
MGSKIEIRTNSLSRKLEACGLEQIEYVRNRTNETTTFNLYQHGK